MGRGEVFTLFWFGGPLERPRRRWKDDIRMDSREIEFDGKNWI
jgi:hypothetical protein